MFRSSSARVYSSCSFSALPLALSATRLKATSPGLSDFMMGGEDVDSRSSSGGNTVGASATGSGYAQALRQITTPGLFDVDEAVRSIRREFPSTSPSFSFRHRSNAERDPNGGYEEDSNPLLSQLKIDTRHLTVKGGRVIAMPFIPRTAPSDFELAAEVIARTLVAAIGVKPLLQFHFEMAFSSAPPVVHSPHIAIAELASSKPLGNTRTRTTVVREGENDLDEQQQQQQQQEGKIKKVSFINRLKHPSAVAASASSEESGANVLVKRSRITHEREATVKVVIRNSRTEAREATGVLVYHVAGNMHQ